MSRPAHTHAKYYDFESKRIVGFDGRARFCPYFFVVSPDTVELGGVLTTVCPLNKWALHGMVDAVMTPSTVDVL